MKIETISNKDDAKGLFGVGLQFLQATSVLESSFGEDSLRLAAPLHFNAMHAAESLVKGLAQLEGVEFKNKHSEGYRIFRDMSNSIVDFPNNLSVLVEYLKCESYTNIRYKDWHSISGSPVSSFIGEAVVFSRWVLRRHPHLTVSNQLNQFFNRSLCARDDLKKKFPDLCVSAT